MESGDAATATFLQRLLDRRWRIEAQARPTAKDHHQGRRDEPSRLNASQAGSALNHGSVATS